MEENLVAIREAFDREIKLRRKLLDILVIRVGVFGFLGFEGFGFWVFGFLGFEGFGFWVFGFLLWLV